MPSYDFTNYRNGGGLEPQGFSLSPNGSQLAHQGLLLGMGTPAN
jgi:hypothetical protein